MILAIDFNDLADRLAFPTGFFGMLYLMWRVYDHVKLDRKRNQAPRSIAQGPARGDRRKDPGGKDGEGSIREIGQKSAGKSELGSYPGKLQQEIAHTFWCGNCNSLCRAIPKIQGNWVAPCCSKCGKELHNDFMPASR